MYTLHNKLANILDIHIVCDTWLQVLSVVLYLNYSRCSFDHFQQKSFKQTAHVLPVELTILIYSVFIQEGEFSFSLESVKKLWEILANGEAAKKTNLLSAFSAVSVCRNPLLPEEFQPLCQSENVQVHFSRLGKQCRIE